MERAGASEMVRVYGEIWQRLKAEIERLVERYMEASAINAEIGVSWVFEFNRLQNLQRQVEEELRHFAAFAESRIVAGQWEAIDAAGQHLAEILMTSTGLGVHVRWDRLPVEAVSDLVGLTRRGSPLRALLDELGPEASKAVRDGLIQGLALGHNPRKVARAIRGEIGGNLVRALRISRTEMLRSYREATRRNYEANSDIIAGWRWLAAKQPRTCAMCLAMDGSFHTLKEHLDDHPNGRCAMVPVLKGDEKKAPSWETGSDWLARQPIDNAGTTGQRRGQASQPARRSLTWVRNTVTVGSTYMRISRILSGEAKKRRRWLSESMSPRLRFRASQHPQSRMRAIDRSART